MGIKKNKRGNASSLPRFFHRLCSCPSFHFLSSFSQPPPEDDTASDHSGLLVLFCLPRIGFYFGGNDAGTAIHPLSWTAGVCAQCSFVFHTLVQRSRQFRVVAIPQFGIGTK